MCESFFPRVKISSPPLSMEKILTLPGNLAIQSALIDFVDFQNDNYILINHLLLMFKFDMIYHKRNTSVLSIHSFIQKVATVEKLERS